VLLLGGVGAIVWGLWGLFWAPNRADLSAYWQLVVAVVAIGIAAIPLLKDSRAGHALSEAGLSEDDWLADQLTDAVKQQWEKAAMERRLRTPDPIPVRWQRSSRAVAASASAAANSTRLAPLTGLSSVRVEQLQRGNLRDVHAVYGGLGSGRLIIIGARGSGKSATALLLVLAAIDHRRGLAPADRATVPVPVMLTAHGWNPDTQGFSDWLVSRLRQTYPLFAGRRGRARAARLVTADRIAVVLDGLDEIPKHLRPVALRALSDQASFRLVVLARSDEMVAATEHSMLEGAVAIELQDVRPGVAADYLTRIQRDPPPDGWRELTDRLRLQPDSPIARALNSPLALTLVRDTYRTGDSVRELLDFRGGSGNRVSRQQIEDLLLNRVLPVAYLPRPGQTAPPYDLRTARWALGKIAERMNQDGTRDLEWWGIPGWASVVPRVVASSLIIGLVTGLVLRFAPAVAGGGDALSMDAGIIALCGIGAWAGLIGSRGARTRERRAPVGWRPVLRLGQWVLMFMAGLGAGIISALVSGFLAAPATRPLIVFMGGVGLVGGIGGKIPRQRMPLRKVFGRVTLLLGVSLGLVVFVVPICAPKINLVWVENLLLVGLVVWLAVGLVRPGGGSASPLTPPDSWGRDRAARLVFGLLFGLVFGLLFGYGFGTLLVVPNGVGLTKIIAGLLTVVVAALVTGLLIGIVSAQTWAASLAFAQLAIRWQTPIRLMRFLDDARARDVLRTVGPVYQFRHARLQDRLAHQVKTDPHRRRVRTVTRWIRPRKQH